MKLAIKSKTKTKQYQLIDKRDLYLNKNQQLEFQVIHPLFDEPEEKIDVEHAGQLKMTPVVKLLLIMLRTYLIIIVLLAFYRIFQLIGIIH